MKSKEYLSKIRKMSKNKLEKEEQKVRDSLARLRLEIAARKVDDISKAKKERRKLAQVITVLNELSEDHDE